MSALSHPAARRADAAAWEGYREARFARSTGTLVVVVDGYAQGLGTPDDGGGRWYTICADHDRLVSHQTLTMAKWHMSAPEEWCEVCAGTEAPDEDD